MKKKTTHDWYPQVAFRYRRILPEWCVEFAGKHVAAFPSKAAAKRFAKTIKPASLGQPR